MQSFLKPLSPQEEQLHVERRAQGDMESRRILIEHNMRLVAHVIKRYNLPEADLEDMLSIGMVGLIKAIDTYRAGRSRLSTYAIRCIENEILMVMRSDKKRRREVSLYEPLGTDKEGNEIRLVDIVESEERDPVTDLYRQECLQRVLSGMEQVLDARELEIMRLRYDASADTELTQREVARRLGISRSYVSRIEKRAIGKLRELL